MTTIDWGAGQYERTADELWPVAEHVVALAALRGGERVLDAACGTGNVALLAARAGADVVGLDGAPRLIEVARSRVPDASFVAGDVQALPFADGEFDVAFSVFGVIFAADAERTVGGLLRVVRPGGRALVTAWVPAGAIDRMVGAFARAMTQAVGLTAPRLAWHDPAAIGPVVARHGADLRMHEGELTVVAESPEAYLEAGEAHHPMSLAGRPLLERAGVYDEARGQALAALREGNEDPAGFRATSPYRVLELTRRR